MSLRNRNEERWNDEDDFVIGRNKKKKKSSKGREKGFGLDMSMPIEDLPVDDGDVAGELEEQAMSALEENSDLAPTQVVEPQSEDVIVEVPQTEVVVPEPVDERKIEVVEEENIEERLDYLRIGLVNDLRIFYGDARVNDQDRKAAEDRLEKNKIKRFFYFDKKQRIDKRDWKSGNVVIALLDKFFSMDSDFPDEWRGSEELVARMGIENDDLIEARKRKIEMEENENIEEVEEGGYVWYDGIIEDLRKITDKGVDFDVRVKTAKKLRDAGVRLPILSDDEEDEEGNDNRIKLGSAVDFLEGGGNNRWGTREAAIEWLKNDLGIYDGNEATEPLEVEISSPGDRDSVDYRGHKIEFVRRKDKELDTYLGMKGDLFLLRLEKFRGTPGFEVVKSRLTEHGIDADSSLALMAE